MLNQVSRVISGLAFVYIRHVIMLIGHGAMSEDSWPEHPSGLNCPVVSFWPHTKIVLCAQGWCGWEVIVLQNLKNPKKPQINGISMTTVQDISCLRELLPCSISQNHIMVRTGGGWKRSERLYKSTLDGFKNYHLALIEVGNRSMCSLWENWAFIMTYLEVFVTS